MTTDYRPAAITLQDLVNDLRDITKRMHDGEELIAKPLWDLEQIIDIIDGYRSSGFYLKP